jgi:hypothetical protein
VEFVGLYYDFNVQAGFSGNVQVCLPYDPDLVGGAALALYHNVGGSWIDITTSVDSVNHVVCGQTQSFSLYVLGKQSNQPPVADAGPAQHLSADASCQALVTLDGSGSHDPENQLVSWKWFFGGQLLASGAQAQVSLGPGSYTIELVVTDGGGASSRAVTTVTVLDTTAPTLQVTMTPSLLWPADGRMVESRPTVTVHDNCDPAPQVSLVSAIGGAAGDIVTESDHLGVMLRAFRTGEEKAGRIYTMSYRAIDSAGNAVAASATVLVPHDQRK